MIVAICFYLLIGVATLMTEEGCDDLNFLPCKDNPLWKLFIIFFWPIVMMMVAIISFKNYIKEVIEYYNKKK